MKGFTLVETIIVVAIISIVSLISMNSILNFQKNSLLESAANEFSSNLKNAKNLSLSGLITQGKTYDYYDPNYMPKYGIIVSGSNSYSSFIQYKLSPISGDTSIHTDTLNSFTINNALSLTPNATLTFARISGITTAKTFILKRIDEQASDKITITVDGEIFVTRL